MKSKLLIFLSVFSLQLAISQNYQTVEEVNDACATLGFSADEDAEIAVDEIMEVIGLQKNFTIQECPNINNAVAKNIENSSGYTVRYIMYDNNFFNNMDAKAGSDWAAISILAHEIGHHLNGHALNNEGSNHEFELDADYFSGLVLAKMGATLEETQSAINTFRYEKATRTHPAKQDRLNEIERGWTKGYNYKNRIKDTGITNESDIANESDITENMEPLVQENYRKAKNGDASAQSNLGYAYHHGSGVNRDYYEAVKWYRKSAEQGYAEGQANLGAMYYSGIGVSQDYYEAVKWFRKAAEQGNAQGQSNLGVMCQNGIGVEKDDYEAVKWYRKAAEQKFASAQQNLGLAYFTGIGVSQDYYEAVNWFRKAAEQGWAGAQNNLGVMYYEGYGVTKNNDNAIYWFKKAARQDNKQAKDILTRLEETW